MQLKVTTWNINSVRLRIDLVAKFIKAVRPDVLCLQETKCPDDAFPLKRFKRLGYEHVALQRTEGLPRRQRGLAPAVRHDEQERLLRQDRLAPRRRDVRREGRAARPADGAQLLRARRRRRARPADQSEIRAQAVVPRRAARVPAHAAGAERAFDRRRRSQRRAAGMRRLEPQGAAQGGVAHADRMRETAGGAEGRQLDRRGARRSCASRRSCSPGGAIARRTGPLPTRAGGSTTSGFRRRSATGSPASRLRRMRAAGRGRRTTFR